MSAFSAAANDEDGDTIKQLRGALQQARDWIAERPDRRPISAGYMVGILTNALAAAPQPPVVEQLQNVKESLKVEQLQGEQELDAFYEWWHMRPSLTRLQAWLIWKDEHKQPPRQPLTDAQINDHRLALPYDGEDLPDPWAFKQGVRAAERAHRIGDDA